MYLSKEEILFRTDDGFDLIKAIYPEATKQKKSFKIRDEKTASSRCSFFNGMWYVKDFGDDDKALNCFDIIIKEIPKVTDFAEAIKYINEEYFKAGVLAPAIVKRKGKEKSEPETFSKVDLIFRKWQKEDFDLLGFNKEPDFWRPVKSYEISIFFSKDKSLKNKYTFESLKEDPYYAIDYTPQEKEENKVFKIYKPCSSDKKYKFFFTGPRPKDYIYGIETMDPVEDKNSLDFIILAAGEKDTENFRTRGFPAFCLNSETAQLTSVILKRIFNFLKPDAKFFVCYDIDKTGIRRTENICDFYKFIIPVFLPEDLLKKTNFRGESAKDITDYFRSYHTKEQLKERDAADWFRQLLHNSTKEHDEKIKKLHNFYTIKKDKNGDYSGIVIQKDSLLDLLMEFGFFSFDIDDETSRFVMIEKNLIAGTNRKRIVNHFLRFIQKLPPCIHKWNYSSSDGGVEKTRKIDYHTIRKTTLNCFAMIFNQDLMLNTMIPKNDIEIKTDTKTSKFFYYKNCYVDVSASGVSLYSYNKLDKHIWKEQILTRDFSFLKKPAMDPENIDQYLSHENISVFEKFVFDITRDLSDDGGAYNTERYKSLQTIIGYNLHNFMQTKLYATILTDAMMSDDGEANGRTGKDLLTQFIGKMLNATDKSRVFTLVPGKDFKLSNKHRYEMCNIETQLVALSDMYNNFNMENIFPDITSGVLVNKKNDKPFVIYPKIMLSSNKTIQIRGESAKDRVIIFELSDHFNSEHSPLTKFGHWFGTEWDEEEWLRFDNFMLSCVVIYFRHLKSDKKSIGIYRTESINIRERTLREHTCREFVGWFHDFVPKIKSGEDYFKKDMFDDFTSCYEDFNNDKGFKQATLTKWIIMYTKQYPEIFDKVDQLRNGTKGDSFRFWVSNSQPTLLNIDAGEHNDIKLANRGDSPF